MVPGCRGRAQKTKMKSAVGFPVPGCRVFHDDWEYWMETKLKGKKIHVYNEHLPTISTFIIPGARLSMI